jgi:hypothetical protein
MIFILPLPGAHVASSAGASVTSYPVSGYCHVAGTVITVGALMSGLGVYTNTDSLRKYILSHTVLQHPYDKNIRLIFLF